MIPCMGLKNAYDVKGVRSYEVRVGWSYEVRVGTLYGVGSFDEFIGVGEHPRIAFPSAFA